ncbi:hypothetical protein BD626DRAFT_485364 [Schizophyllum amplum]|uniref:Uncharacterized protein n=1 Tax=Schizophyllum amplum TaxID=97359 RepID=A0A550CR77_9AGAR|nr:hypothetical protein BD626DRAFT_485364 [Auriculariopsis ampla]
MWLARQARLNSTTLVNAKIYPAIHILFSLSSPSCRECLCSQTGLQCRSDLADPLNLVLTVTTSLVSAQSRSPPHCLVLILVILLLGPRSHSYALILALLIEAWLRAHTVVIGRIHISICTTGGSKTASDGISSWTEFSRLPMHRCPRVTEQ